LFLIWNIVVRFAMPLVTRSATGAETRTLSAGRRRPLTIPNPTGTPSKVDEDILTYSISDEAIEAAAGIERGAFTVTDRLCGCFRGRD
jgi:hypothetical protein